MLAVSLVGSVHRSACDNSAVLQPASATALLRRFLIAHSVKSVSACYVTRRFVTLFQTALHRTLITPNTVQNLPHYPFNFPRNSIAPCSPGCPSCLQVLRRHFCKGYTSFRHVMSFTDHPDNVVVQISIWTWHFLLHSSNFITLCLHYNLFTRCCQILSKLSLAAPVFTWYFLSISPPKIWSILSTHVVVAGFK